MTDTLSAANHARWHDLHAPTVAVAEGSSPRSTTSVLTRPIAPHPTWSKSIRRHLEAEGSCSARRRKSSGRPIASRDVSGLVSLRLEDDALLGDMQTSAPADRNGASD